MSELSNSSGPADLDIQGNRPKWFAWTLAAIFLIAVVVRVVGCFDAGLPHTFYKDEENNVERALSFGARRSLDPQWFNKPALGYYILFVEFGAYFLTGRLLGTWSNAEEFAAHYFNDPSGFLLIGRLNACLFGLLGILLTYHLGKRVRDHTMGLIATAFLAVSVGQIASCQEVKKDVVSAFFTTWSMLLLLSVMEKGRKRDYAWSGFLAGLGMATKYYAVALALPCLLAHWLRSPEAKARSRSNILSPRLGLLGLAFLFGFFVGSPYNFLNPIYFESHVMPSLRFVGHRLGSLVGLLEIPFPITTDVGAEGSLVDPRRTTFSRSMSAVLQSFMSDRGVGFLFSALIVVGTIACVIGVRQRTMAREGTSSRPVDRRMMFLVLSFLWCIPFIALFNRQLSEARHLNMLYPLAAVIGAFGFRAIYDRLVDDLIRRPAWLGHAVLGFTLLVSLPIPGFPVFESVRQNLRKLEPDNRARVAKWIEENVPRGATVINARDWIPLKSTKERSTWMRGRVDQLRVAAARAYDDAKALDENNAERAIRMKWAKDDLESCDTYDLKAGYQLLAAVHGANHPRFDIIVTDTDWMTETLTHRLSAASSYSPIWPRSAYGPLFARLLENAPAKFTPADAHREFLRLLRQELRPWIERRLRREGIDGSALTTRVSEEILLAERQFELTEDSVAMVELWRRPSPVCEPWVTDGTQADWMVSVKVTYDNYLRAEKRLNFPDWAAFYDDLKAHYDALQFGEDRDDRYRVVRVFDLRRRVAVAKVERSW